jgi:uncharacterized repeat protein (TIGR01451 family)
MTFVTKQNAVKSARSWAARGLMLALLGSLSTLAGVSSFTGGATSLTQSPLPEAIAQSTTRTINLNTGFDQWAATLIAVGGLDNEWRVITDPTSTPPEPPGNGVSTGRPADVVGGGTWAAFNPALPGLYPNSGWISVNPAADPGPQNPPTTFRYAFYFTLPAGFASPQLTLQISADDHVTRVQLNGCTLFSGSGGGFAGSPLAVSSSTQGCFNSGPNVNVLMVDVEDTAGGITGLIVDGKVTYEDCDRQPIRDIPGLTSITFWESTVANLGDPPTAHTFSVSGPELTTQLPALTPASRDFAGVPGQELYDVFYSDWDGTFNPTGEFVTIEAVWPVAAPSGGGLNIARVDFNGTGQYADSIASFVALGDNAMPNNVVFAVDGNLLTDTTMGNTSGQTQRLRVTVGFPCPCVQAPSGMTAWWTLDEPNGASIVNDIAPPPSSTANNQGVPKPGGLVGSPNGPDAVTGVNGALQGAMYFIGPYLEVSSQADVNFGTGDFTIDAWIKPVSLVDANFLSLIVHKMDANGVGYALYTLGNGAGGRELRLVMNNQTYTSNPGITSTSWYHVAVTVQRSSSSPTGTFYINGQQSGLFTPITANLDNSSPLLIGASFVSGLVGLPQVGRHEITIDELEIFKRELSQNDIQLIAFNPSKCKRGTVAEPTADLGDAPDSTNHPNKPMTAYPSVPAKFPTVFDPATGLPQGPKHLQPKGLAWLGPDVSFENEADLLPDADGVTNIDPTNNAANQDKFDDGVVLPIAIPMICGQTQFKYTVTSTVAAKLYVNIWFDFNRDGDWNDPLMKCPLGPAVTGSFAEWAVQNELITVPAGSSGFTTPVFGAANPTKGSEMWMRITLTDQPIAPANGADGSGPASGYQFGETEDYLLKLQYTELCGIKFNDLNGNGQQDPGEPGLAGWVIEVKDANGNIIGYAVTDANGKYCIVVPSPGQYTVSEQQQAGWTQTAPTTGSYAVTVPPAHTNLNFGNKRKEEKAEICIFKFEDLDGDGVKDPNEPLLGGWQFNVSPAPLPPATSPVTTLPGGGICFGVSAPGTYTITEQVQSGWTVTTANPQMVNVSPGQLVNVFFGNKKKDEKFEICGIKWNDLNGNGKQDPGEPGLPNWTINMVFGTPPNLIDVQATTDANGKYCFTGLASGTYKISETLQPGWIQTFPPSPGKYTVTVPPSVTNINFGNQQGKCDLAIKKTVDPNPPVAGQPFAFAVTVTNVGTGPCPPTTTVTDNLPIGFMVTSFIPNTAAGWVCPSGPPSIVCNNTTLTLQPGQSSMVFAVVGTMSPGVSIENCAELKNPNDTNPNNNKDCIKVTPVGKCDLQIRKSVTPNPVQSGQPVTITLTVQNVGTAPCGPDTVVQDPPTPGLTVPSQTVAIGQSGGTAAWGCLILGGGVQCVTASTLPVGYTATFTFTATVTIAPPPGGVANIQNCATVKNPSDTNPANNQSCVTINVIGLPPPPDLALAKLLDGQLRVEQEATYVLRVANVGQGPTTSPIIVTDPLPPTLRFVSASGPGWSCSAQGQNVTCRSAGPIAPGQTSTILLRVRVAAPAGTQITNCATVETAGDANPANNRGCHTGTVQR